MTEEERRNLGKELAALYGGTVDDAVKRIAAALRAYGFTPPD